MMKKLQLRIITSIFAGLFLGLFVFTSCEGPEGPAGINGTDGTNGVAGEVACMACHNTDVKSQITSQFAQSQHASGAIAVDYAGARAGCAECHSHEGFVEWAYSGEVSGDIAAPSAWECNTCHNLHNTFDSTDYAFRVNGAVTMVDGSGAVIDQGNNNLCINCHQARTSRSSFDKDPITYTKTFTGADYEVYAHTTAIGPNGSVTPDTINMSVVVVFDVPAGYSYISSTHAGPHHGTQGNLWAGLGGTETGTMYGPHSGGCVTCHMGEESNHSFKPETANCEGCHGDKDAEMDAIADRIQAVGEALEAIHAVHYSDGAFHPVYASLEKDQFDAWWNFMYVLEDRSNSAHNPSYIKSLIDQCETALGL